MFQRFFSTPRRTFKSKIVYAQKVGKNALMYFVRPSYVEHSKWLPTVKLSYKLWEYLIWYGTILLALNVRRGKKLASLKKLFFYIKVPPTYLQIVMFPNNIYVVVGTSTFNPEYPFYVYVAAVRVQIFAFYLLHWLSFNMTWTNKSSTFPTKLISRAINH